MKMLYLEMAVFSWQFGHFQSDLTEIFPDTHRRSQAVLKRLCWKTSCEPSTTNIKFLNPKHLWKHWYIRLWRKRKYQKLNLCYTSTPSG